MEKFVRMRNAVNSFLYKQLLKRVFFLFDPEFMHTRFIAIGKILGKYKLKKRVVHSIFYYENPSLKQEILGIKFDNPVGLSAGFDKNAEIISICEDMGFGFSEVGSITKLSHSGNPGKRLERLVDKKSIWVNLGLNNNGVNEISRRLKNRRYKIPFGVSIAKTNCRETVNDKIGREDYIYSLKKLSELKVGYFYVLNISCPNAYGGQPFSRLGAYEDLLKGISKIKVKKPIFVKLSPDLTKKNVDGIIKLSAKYGIDGFIISNLTKKHEKDKGGVSGKLVEGKANSMLKYVYSKTHGKFVLIGVGGIFSAEDAYKKIRLGASLVELITGMIYRGPQVIGEINQGLVELLKKDGFNNIGEAVGADVQ